MNENEKHENKVVTPLVTSHEGSKRDEKPKSVDIEAPVSTDEGGGEVDLPDLGGRID